MTDRLGNGKALWLASVAALAPVAISQVPVAPAQASPSGEFQPPAEAMVLTRTLRKHLPGGAEIRTERSYEIWFIPEAGGYRIDGKLVDVLVEAPPGLEALAAIEKARPDDGMFPIRLDSRGSLIFGQQPQPSAAVREASALTLRQVNTLGLGREEAAQSHAFVRQFEKRPGNTAWPEDLFRPAPGKRSESRAIPLPNGDSGQVSVAIEASTAESGLLSSFARIVTTRMGNSSRVTEEIWTLSGKG